MDSLPGPGMAVTQNIIKISHNWELVNKSQLGGTRELTSIGVCCSYQAHQIMTLGGDLSLSGVFSQISGEKAAVDWLGKCSDYWSQSRGEVGMFNILHSGRLLFHRCKLSSWQNSEDVRQTFLANTYQASRYNKWLPVSLLKNKAGYLIDASIGFSSYCNVVRVYTGWPSKGIFRIILNDLKLKNGRNIKFNFSQLKSLMVTEWLNGSQLPEMHPHLQIMEERIRLQNVQSICWNKIFSIIMQAVIRAGSVLVTLMVMVSWLWCLSI